MTSTIQSIPVDPTPPASGEGLIFNGTVYVPTPANPGDITAVNTTLPLTGGGVSGALTLDINNFTGDSGLGGLDGAVPAPAAGDAAAGKFLKADGNWAVPPAGGGAFTNLVFIHDDTNLQVTGAQTVPGMTANIVATKANLMVNFLTDVFLAAGQNAGFRIEIDGSEFDAINNYYYGKVFAENLTAVALDFPLALTNMRIPVTLGAHTVRIWRSGSGNVFLNNSGNSIWFQVQEYD